MESYIFIHLISFLFWLFTNVEKNCMSVIKVHQSLPLPILYYATPKNLTLSIKAPLDYEPLSF